MAVELGQGYVSVIPSTKGFAAALTSQTRAPMAAAGGSMGGLFSAGFAKAILGPVGIGVALVGALGAAGLASALSLDKAYDTIRTKTGQTGGALKGLKSDFKAVFREVPTDAGAAGLAIGELSTRLGLSGPPLQNMAKQMLELSRLTGTDLSENIRQVSRVFGDWSIASKDQSKAADYLYKVTQKTGGSVAGLGQTIVQYGAPLRGLGFTFEEAAVMVGKFEKEGVNIQTVLGGLRMGLGRLTRAGKDPRKVFDDLTESVEKSGLTADNTKTIFEIFGARAGQDLAKAIEEGRFKLSDLTAAIKGSDDTILKAAADTKDFGESWQQFKALGMTVIEPIGIAIMSVLNPALQSAVDLGNGFVSALEKGKSPIAALRDGIGKGFGEGGLKLFDDLAAAGKPVLDALQPIVENAKRLWRNLGGAKDSVGGFKQALADFVKSGDYKMLADDSKEIGKSLAYAVRGFEHLTKGIGAFVSGGQVPKAVSLVKSLHGAYVFWVSAPMEIVGAITTALGNLWGFSAGLGQALGGLGDAVRATLFAIVDIGPALGGIWAPIKKDFDDMGRGVQNFCDGVVRFFTDLYNELVGHSIIPDIVNGIIRWFAYLPVRAVIFVRRLATDSIRALAGLPGSFATIAAQTISRFVSGISAGAAAVAKAGRDLADKLIRAVKDFLGIKSPSRVFQGIGGQVVSGMVRGLNFKSALGLVKRFFGGLGNFVAGVPSLLSGLLDGGDLGTILSVLGGATALGGNAGRAMLGLRAAMTTVGDPYIWGASGPNAFDCSGLVSWLLSVMGFNFGRFLSADVPSLFAEGWGKLLTIGWKPGHTGIGILGQWFEAKGRNFGVLGPGSARTNWASYFHIPGFSEGGISRGPRTGYPTVLHGTEGIFTRDQMSYLAPAYAGGGDTFTGPWHINVPDGRLATFKREVERARDRERTGQS